MTYQIPYHELDVPINPLPLPPEYSSLHTLYPGVPYPRTQTYDRYNILHCDPCAAKTSFDERREDTIQAAKSLEKLALKSGGGPEDKVTIRAVADPSIMIEDPALLQLSTQAPVALNDGMEFPVKKDIDPRLDTRGDLVGPPRENFGPIETLKESRKVDARIFDRKVEKFQATPSVGGGQCHSQVTGDMLYVLVFVGFLVLIGLLGSAFLGIRKR